MSLNAATIEFLLGKGLSGEDLLVVARSLEAQNQRSSGAVRQKRYRDNGGGNIPEDLRQRVFERDGWACLECDSERDLCCDHATPVSKGGETTLDNLQTLCRPCNSRKKDRERKYDKRQMSAESPRKVRGKSNGHTPPNDNILTPPCLEKPEPRGSVKKSKFPAPNGVEDGTWLDFLASPKRRKAGMSQTAYAGIVNNLRICAEHGFPPGEMIALAVERGWTTVKLEWVQNDQRKQSHERPDNPLGIALQRVNAAIANR